MPQPMNNAVMTHQGARLLTRAQAGECVIQFTRIAIGDGEYAENERTSSALQEAMALKAERNSYTLSSIEIYSDYSVMVRALITNQDPVTSETLITSGYYINEMGLFAKEKDGGDETEVLYSICITSGENGDFMPPYNGYNPAQIIQDYYVTVNNSAEVTIQAAGAAALAEDFIKAREELDRVVAALATLRFSYSEEDETLILTGESEDSGSSFLPIAGMNTLGCVMIGEGVSIDESGRISVDLKTISESDSVAEAIVEAGTEDMTEEEVTEAFNNAGDDDKPTGFS